MARAGKKAPLLSLRKATAVDFSHLERITFNNVQLAHEVLALFDTQAAQLLSKIQRTRSLPELAALAHTLKGAARGIGAWKVAAACENLEHAAQIAEASALSQSIATFAAAIEEARRHIAPHLTMHRV
jgi:HPt (histidine-containing phosphotransfer) domain-containing protein